MHVIEKQCARIDALMAHEDDADLQNEVRKLMASMRILNEKVAQLIQEEMCNKYPELIEFKTKVVRRVV